MPNLHAHYPFSITPPLRKSSHSGQNKCGDENETANSCSLCAGRGRLRRARASLARTHPLDDGADRRRGSGRSAAAAAARTRGKPALPLPVRRGMHHGGGICGRLHGQPAFPAARVGLLARIRQRSRTDLPEIRRAVDAARRADHAAEIRRKCVPLPLQYGFQWLIIVINYAEKETHHADRSQCRKQPRFARRL